MYPEDKIIFALIESTYRKNVVTSTLIIALFSGIILNDDLNPFLLIYFLPEMLSSM